jgi:hypothetical protein
VLIYNICVSSYVSIPTCAGATGGGGVCVSSFAAVACSVAAVACSAEEKAQEQEVVARRAVRLRLRVDVYVDVY